MRQRLPSWISFLRAGSVSSSWNPGPKLQCTWEEVRAGMTLYVPSKNFGALPAAGADFLLHCVFILERNSQLKYICSEMSCTRADFVPWFCPLFCPLILSQVLGAWLAFNCKLRSSWMNRCAPHTASPVRPYLALWLVLPKKHVVSEVFVYWLANGLLMPWTQHVITSMLEPFKWYKKYPWQMSLPIDEKCTSGFSDGYYWTICRAGHMMMIHSKVFTER